MKPTVILGAGLTGLTLGYRLKQAGRPVVVLEEAENVGGCVQTARSGELLAERGPNSILTKPSTDRLIEDLGLASRVVVGAPDAPRYIVRGGRPVELAPGPKAMFAPILSWPAKLRVAADLVKGTPAELEDESIHAFFTRRFGEEVATYLAGPFVSGVYAGDPRAISVRSAFPKLWEAERTYRVGVIRGFTKMRKDQKARGIAPYKRKTLSLRGGLVELVDALRAKLGPDVVTSAPVTAIVPAGAGNGTRFTVTAGGRSYDAASVVATIPSHRLGEVLGPIAPGVVDPLSRIPTVAVATVSLAYPDDAFPSPPSGFGTLIPRCEDYRILGCLYMSALFPDRAPRGKELLTCFIGGAFDPQAVALSDDELVRAVTADVGRLLRLKRGGELVSITRWERGIPQYTMGHHTRVAAVDEAVKGLAGLHVTGNWKDGVAMADRIEAAERLAATLGKD